MPLHLKCLNILFPFQKYIMEDHKSYTDGFCRLCDSKLQGHNQYKVLSWSQEINHAYRSDNIDISRDDPICQSSLICQVCYRNLQKVKEEMKHKKKNPTSSKHFRYQMPPYRENVKVHLVKDCLCQQEGAEPAPDPAAEPGGVEGHDNPDHLMGVTPSKVRRLMELPEVSPSDKPTAREARKKTPRRTHIKFEHTPGEIFETGEVHLEEASVRKVFTSTDSFPANRISHLEVGRFFLCRVCGQYPKTAKASKMCLHIYCALCIDNYKRGVESSKCPPAHQDDNNDDKCIVPSSASDIVMISSFVKEIHESIKISCKNEHCEESYNVKEILDHEQSCKKREFHHKDKKSLESTRSKPLLKDADLAIDNVVQWSQTHKVSPCNFLFFALKRLITREAPELKESVQSVFKLFLKKADLKTRLTAIEGLAVKTNADMSNLQYRSLRRNKLFRDLLPSIQSVTNAKETLDPGNVDYKVFKKSNGELIEIHSAQPNSGIIDVDEDLGNFSYGDLNINVQGCRATLHDTICKLLEEKYPEIEEHLKESKVYDSFYSDHERKMTVYAKVCFDGTSAAVKSAKGDSRLPISNWLRGTVGIVGVDFAWQEGGLTEVGEAADPMVEDSDGEDDPFTLQNISNMNIFNLDQIRRYLPDNIKKMSIRDIVNQDLSKL